MPSPPSTRPSDAGGGGSPAFGGQRHAPPDPGSRPALSRSGGSVLSARLVRTNLTDPRSTASSIAAATPYKLKLVEAQAMLRMNGQSQHYRSASIGKRFDYVALAPAAAALCYPFLLRAFHAVVGRRP